MASHRVTMRSTTVVTEYVDHEAGHWCGRCNLSTGFRFWVAVRFTRSDGTRSAMFLQERRWCSECDSGRHVRVDADADHT